MGRTCSICNNPARESINAALEQGTPYRTIANQYDVSRDALMRHAKGHLPGKLLRQTKVRAVPHARVREPHQDKMLTLANSQAVPYARTHEGKRPTLDKVQALADLERRVDALQRRLGDLRRDLQAWQLEERRRRHRAQASWHRSRAEEHEAKAARPLGC